MAQPPDARFAPAHSISQTTRLGAGRLRAGALLRRRPAHPERVVGCWDYPGLTRQLGHLAGLPGIEAQRLGWVNGAPLDVLRLVCPHHGTKPRLRVVVSAGVHGVEPAGPAAALLVLGQLLDSPERSHGLDLTVLPLVNPVGYRAQTRGNGQQVDLNRSFFDHDTVPPEVRLVRAVLAHAPYDLGIDLHASRSVGERGVFALHRNSGDLLKPAMQRFGARHPILRESTDQYRLEADGVLKSQNVGTIKDYLLDHGTRWAMTIETPAAWDYERQVQASTDIVHTLIETARDLLK